MSCPCDRPRPPDGRAIAPGLPVLPRAIGDFSAFRSAMLAGVRRWPALDAWRARDRDDLGVMVLEFWAYVADVVAFYDQVHANESYLRTAVRRPSLDRIVGLLGYRPRPASAASALLAVLAEGRAEVSLPAATAFRSSAFDDQPPQVFENEAAGSAHPLANRWSVRAPRLTTLADGGGQYVESHLDCEPRRLDLDRDDLVLVRTALTTIGVHRVSDVSEITAADGTAVVRVGFTGAVSLPRATPARDIDLLRPTAQVGLWIEVPSVIGTLIAIEVIGAAAPGSPGAMLEIVPAAPGATPSAAEAVGSGTIGVAPSGPADGPDTVALERLQPVIGPGDTVILSKDTDHRWFRVLATRAVNKVVRHAETVVQPPGSEAADYTLPAATTRTTELTLDAGINAPGRRGTRPAWNVAADAGTITLRFALVRAARVATRPKMALWPDAPLDLQPAADGRIPMPPAPEAVRRFILEDASGLAYAVKGSLDAGAGRFEFAEQPEWAAPLVPPVTVYGNVLDVRRGETVREEILGSGDRSAAGQVFELAKTPHTYLPDTTGATARGYRSTITVWVDGVRWAEVESLVTSGPEDPVFVLRQNDDGATEVVFGDGVNGRRLPTGSANVVARYRHGAGAAAPPARGISQLARPVANVSSVVNPLPAGGGADAESADDTRENAPGVAMLLGRIVSLEDVRAVAAAYPGLIAVRAEWRWHAERQAAVVEADCITDGVDLALLHEKIRNLCEPGLAVTVAEAEAVPLRLSLSIELDADHVAAEVLAAVRTRLTDPDTGLLAPARIGIGTVLFRSRIHAETLAVPGTVAVRSLLADGAPLDAMGLDPGAGRWFDVAAGGLVLNGLEDDADGQ